MATGTGLDSQLGGAKETTYGTRVVPTRFWEFGSESLQLAKTFVVSTQLGSGAMFPRGSRRTATVRQAGGDISFEAPNQGLSWWVDLLHANAVTPAQQGGSAAYLHTHNIGTTSPTKSATIQVGRTSTDGTTRPFDYLGCMLTGAEFSWDIETFLRFTATIDAQEEKTDQALATRSLPTSLESFVFTQGALTIGGSNIADVGPGNIAISQPLATDRFRLGSSGLKSKPILNDFQSVSGSLTADFTDLTAYTRYVAGTRAAVVLTFTGNLIAATYYHKIIITMSDVGFDGETPNVGGPDMLTQTIPFRAFYDGTNPPLKVEITTTDTTV